MSHTEDKFKHSKRLQKDTNAVQKQYKIAKQHSNPPAEPHIYHKKHAMDCGNPQCALCGNPRHIRKDKLTAQEKRLFQDLEQVRDKKSNGTTPDQI